MSQNKASTIPLHSPASMLCIEPLSAESTQQEEHDDDVGSEGGLSPLEPPAGDNKSRKGRKRRKTEGASTSSFE